MTKIERTCKECCDKCLAIEGTGSPDGGSFEYCQNPSCPCHNPAPEPDGVVERIKVADEIRKNRNNPEPAEGGEKILASDSRPSNERPLMRHNICCKKDECRLPENHSGECSNAECSCGNGFAYHECPKPYSPSENEGWREAIIDAWRENRPDDIIKIVSQVEKEAEERGYNKGLDYAIKTQKPLK